jgi:hypothetical protein
VAREYIARIPEPHEKQAPLVNSKAKRNIARCGRRSGKTFGLAIREAEKFLGGARVLYATPTQDQLDRFWGAVCQFLRDPIEAGVFYKNETTHLIEIPGTDQRIRGKTAWNADMLRGDYADELVLDEFQLMNEEVWELVGAPMLADNDGAAVFLYTPPSLHARATKARSKARDPQHAAKMFKRAAEDTSGRWATFHWTSKDNPHISQSAIEELAKDMTALSYRMEILAEDVTEAPGALWNRDLIETLRWTRTVPDLARIIVGVDPSGTSDGAEAGIVAGGRTKDEGFLLRDSSLQASPRMWAEVAVALYHELKADLIVAEKNFGGEMVELTIKTVDPKVRVKLVSASRGKQLRAEPVAAIYENKRIHHVGSFPLLEDEMCLWMPGDKSPNRLDAMVWTMTELMLLDEAPGTMEDPFASW